MLGFGVRFEAFFWIIAVFIGLRFGQDNIGKAVLWIGLVTASVLLHELGHAMAYRHYGAKARISMTGWGGLTYGTDTSHITPKQQIVISLAGSTVEMLFLGFPAIIIRSMWDPAWGSWAYLTLTWLIWINVTWALVNLAPVWPMDGGKVIEQVFILRSGHNRMRLVHKISVIAGVIAAMICWNYGIRFGTWMFIFFVVLNLFGMQALKTKKPYQLWPGVDTANGTSHKWEDHLVAKPMTSHEHLKNGFAALVDERTHDTDRHLAEITETRRASKKDQALASELSLWRQLTAGRPDLAEASFDTVAKPTATLRAVMSLCAVHSDDGLRNLADGIVSESDHPASEQGILWAARNGYIVQLVTVLLEAGSAFALGHAVRIEEILGQAGLHDERRKIESLV